MRKLIVALGIVSLIGFSPLSVGYVIPVYDAANWLENMLDRVAQVKELALTVEELEKLRNQVRALADLIGLDGAATVLEKAEEQWGTRALEQVISGIDPESPMFEEDTIQMMSGVLGGEPLDEAAVDTLISGAGIEDEYEAEEIRKRFDTYYRRDMSYRDSLLGASSMDSRREAIQEQIETAKDQLSTLGPESDVASIQFVGETNLLLANQNQELLGLLTRLYARQTERNMMDNMDAISEKKARLEYRKRLQSDEFNTSPVDTGPVW